jgi:hypothetical protein
MQTKHCTKCGEHRPFSDFNKSKSRADGLQDHCKVCRSQHYKANRDKVREYNQQYYEANRDKARESNRQYREANRDKALNYGRQWRENNLGYIQNYRENNRDKIRESSRQWRETNLDKVNAKTAKRRAAKMQRTPHWLTPEQLEEIETFYTVAIAFRIYTGQDYHVDHIVPLQGKNVSGLHVPWNLQVLPKKENLKKGNK